MINAELVQTRREISERIDEAYFTLRRMPDATYSRLAMQVTAWPGLIYDPDKMEAGAWRRSCTSASAPTSVLIARMDEALDWMLWLAALDRVAARVVYLCCARHIGPVALARRMGRHRETVAVWRDNALDKIAAYRLRKAAA